MKYQPDGLPARFARVSLLVVVWLVCQSTPLRAATYTVSNVNDSGAGSLRQAILDANSNSGPDTIVFQISGTGPFTINLLSALPSVTDPVVIDATTQTGYAGTPRVELNGAGIGGNSADGLAILAGGSTVKGLAINRCPRDGIRLSGFGTNVIQANYLGTDVTGSNALGNAEGGLYIFRSPGNVIGGTNAAARNVISGGNLSGLYLDGTAATGNLVEGNYIGTSVSGTARLGNQQNGVVISAAPRNTIGGLTAGARNVISGNGQSGVYFINSGATSNLIEGNFIGTDATGSLALSNGADGVTISGVVGNTIGGAAAGAQNVISGNNGRGVFIYTTGATGNVVAGNLIGTDATGKLALGNQAEGVTVDAVSGNTIGGTTALSRNVISANLQSGVLIIAGGTGNTVAGNFIGLDITGTNALSNSFSGVTLDGVTGNLIGGTTPGSGNVISGNSQNGVYVVDTGAGTNTIAGNFIGTDSTGTRAVGNALAGVRLDMPGNTVGGTTASARNVISGNQQSGVFMNGSSASGNVIEGNFIGTDVTGANALGNGFPSTTYSGITISGAPSNVIGGTTAGSRNVISGNADFGIYLTNSGTTGTLIQGNYIGTDLTGSLALGNPWGGIYISSAPSNTIGGAVTGAGNLVSGNGASGGDGIFIGNTGANGNVIQGNFIGTQADGISPLGNGHHNIEIASPASYTLIGGSTAAADNRIAFAGPLAANYSGIRIRDGCIGNFISRNSIFSNGAGSHNGLGIDLGVNGVTPNDLGDPDVGANELQNFPVLTNAYQTGVHGALNSFANGTFLLQFYASPTTNISGYGEGMNYLCSTNVTTDGSGNTSFDVPFPSPIAAGQFITATATDATNNTSEFCAALVVTQDPAVRITAAGSGGANRQFNLLWPTNPASFGVLQATNLTPPVTWTPLTNVPALSGTSNRITLAPTNGPVRFFRLQAQ